jgi:DNA-binding CsgD family transcriptional regulator
MPRPLTRIERDTLFLVSIGTGYRLAGRMRGRSMQSAKSALAGARRNLGARNTAHAVALAIRQGLI